MLAWMYDSRQELVIMSSCCEMLSESVLFVDKGCSLTVDDACIH